MPDERLTFKQMCARFEVTPRTLRYYEYIELLQPEKEGRTRYYTARETARMTLILRGRSFGFSLEEIRQWLELYEEEGTEAQTRAFLDMADRQLKALGEQRRQLDATIDALRELRADVGRTLNAADARHAAPDVPAPQGARRAGSGGGPAAE